MNFRTIWVSLGLLLAVAEPAHCGLYNTAEPVVEPSTNLSEFLNQLNQLRAYGPADPLTATEPSKERETYLAKALSLREREARGELSAEESANLGAYLIRLRRTRPGIPFYEEAIEVLERARRRFPRNFYILANLGTAYQLTGRLDAAESCLLDAQGLAPVQLRKMERYHLLLVRLRRRERLSLGQAPLDQLFRGRDQSPVRFVGESGHWEVGGIAASEVAKLPSASVLEATRIVQQLLIWLPDDARLYWLLGELANAQGQIRAAYQAMDRAVDSFRLSTREVRRRRFLLHEWLVWDEGLKPLGKPDKKAQWVVQHVASAGQPWSPPAATAWRMAIALPRPKQPQLPALSFDDPKPPDHGPPLSIVRQTLANLGWRGWAIVVVTMALIAGLLLMQLREIRRRRAASPPGDT